MNISLEQLASDKSQIDGLVKIGQEIASGHGQEAFKQLWGDVRAKSDTNIDAVQRLMEALENVWNHDEGIAGYLMGRLLSLASRYKLHNVYNAVELYFWSSDSESLTRSLERLCAENVSPRRVLEWHLRRIMDAAK